MMWPSRRGGERCHACGVAPVQIERLEAYARADPQHRPETTVKAIVALLRETRDGTGAD